MTREEAIRALTHMKYNLPYGYKALDMAIEALQGDMYCPNCGVRLVTEDEYLEPTQKFERKE